MDTYEKKYKDAMERMKLCVRSGLKITPEYIFTELAESEDEKARKELIKHLKELSDWKEDEVIPVKNPSYYRQWASWLKKQAEHANFLSKIQVGDKVTRNEAGVLVNLSQLDRVAKKNEKQCKQKFEMKTAEESLGIDSDTYNKIVDECIFGEQKTKENKGNLGGISPNWSEKDNWYVEDIISLLDFGGSIHTKEQIQDWLRSLQDRVQPQNKWKPSVEQMECLSDAIEHYNSLGYPASKLKELLDDLKKLKEGEV